MHVCFSQSVSVRISMHPYKLVRILPEHCLLYIFRLVQVFCGVLVSDTYWNSLLYLSFFKSRMLWIILVQLCLVASRIFYWLFCFVFVLLFCSWFKTGQSEKVEGMMFRPNTQTENNVQENNFSLNKLISLLRLRAR